MVFNLKFLFPLIIDVFLVRKERLHSLLQTNAAHRGLVLPIWSHMEQPVLTASHLAGGTGTVSGEGATADSHVQTCPEVPENQVWGRGLDSPWQWDRGCLCCRNATPRLQGTIQ